MTSIIILVVLKKQETKKMRCFCAFLVVTMWGRGPSIGVFIEGLGEFLVPSRSRIK